MQVSMAAQHELGHWLSSCMNEKRQSSNGGSNQHKPPPSPQPAPHPMPSLPQRHANHQLPPPGLPPPPPPPQPQQQQNIEVTIVSERVDAAHVKGVKVSPSVFFCVEGGVALGEAVWRIQELKEQPKSCQGLRWKR